MLYLVRRLLQSARTHTSTRGRVLGVLGALGLCVVGIEPFLPSPWAPRINVRWDAGVGTEERQRLETQFGLVQPSPQDGTTWRYDLVDTTRQNIAALVAHPAAADTDEIDRQLGTVLPGRPRGTTLIRFPVVHRWRQPQVLAGLAAVSATAFLYAAVSLVLSVWPWSGRMSVRWSVGLIVTSGAWAVAFIGETSPLRVIAAGIVLYLFGYVTGSLLVPPREADTDRPSILVRTLVGLLMSTVAYFLSLRFSMPWVAGPAALLLAAVVASGTKAFRIPEAVVTWRWDAALAAVAAVIVVSPVLVAAAHMSPGVYPPVFFNVDTPYSLGHVHSLVKTTTFPPPSLNVLGGQPIYHYGIQGIAALVSRSSGVAPHHSLFLVVLPLLVAGIIAAAAGLIKRIGPQLPWSVSLPFLLIPAPTFWYAYSSVVGARVGEAVNGLTVAPVARLLVGEPQLWGVASIVAHNVAIPFLVLVCLAGIVDAPTRGWRLPVFVAGIAFLVKVPTGLALLAGFGLVQLCRAVVARNLRRLMPAVAAALMFALAYGLLWFQAGDGREIGLELSPFFHLRSLWGGGELWSFGADVVWLLAPALVVLVAAPGSLDPVGRWLLVFALAPLLVVNTVEASAAGRDWLQVLFSVPLVLRALVLRILAQRWSGLGLRWRVAVCGVVAVVTLPGLLAAASYTASLIEDRANGHEFLDNRAMAEALAVIPVTRSVIVTNDLRNPAQGSSTRPRHLQIAALFGHQAFAAVYTYESYSFSGERLVLQALLEAETWTDAIGQAARQHQWTHFLVHKNYAHPAKIPLEQLFENDAYVVYQFPGTTGAGTP